MIAMASTSVMAGWLEDIDKGKQVLELGQQILNSQPQQQQQIQYQQPVQVPAPVQQVGGAQSYQTQAQAAPYYPSSSGTTKIGVFRETNQCASHYPLGSPVIYHPDADKINRRAFYTCQQNYATMQDPQTKTPLWVSEVLLGSQQQNTHVERIDNFMPHPSAPRQVQASLNDFRGSGFDRGHMAPAGDMLNPQAMDESFYMTNMVPQVGPNMNRGIWADLEAMVRKWSVARGMVQVYTGPIFEGQVQTIGTSAVWVPTYLYKVVIDPKTYETIAFIMPNRQIVTRSVKKLNAGNESYPQTTEKNSVNCGRVCKIDDFIVPLKTVEDKTGIYFFPRLPDSARPIANQQSRMWHAR